ncbi:metal ABC transporter ATP-binding protein [Agrococcus casei]|uniref:Zinc ABC transporter, ATP-binding protein ZnuC n=1 Tax=Agrococcus casei LMG 22410 TaxID=1255656 RepID=A0A1R4ES02_9MICO|nr:metal ABC transporter ATP-binding protein [Agrococcus casei]SJM46391.1 Zinc ABC transporter, ATP-binding protein ZnuC [Agrococcus casei LMG 22410]
MTGVTFEVQAGEAVALIGPNGAGKSTLLQALLGQLKHTAKRFEVPTGAGQIGLLPQRQSVTEDFPVTLQQVVTMGRIPHRGILWPSRDDRSGVQRALEEVGLWNLRKRRFGELSGGQRQRGLLARALASDPKLMLLDEPFNGLDAPSREQLIAIVRRLKARGVGFLITTHDIDLARQVTERTLLLNQKQIDFDETECALTLEQVQRVFDHHAVEIDGHTLATAEHHNEMHHGDVHGRPEDPEAP